MLLDVLYISANPAKTRWLTAKAKILQQSKDNPRLLDAGREIVRLMRREKAQEYISQIQLAYEYKITGKLKCRWCEAKCINKKNYGLLCFSLVNWLF